MTCSVLTLATLEAKQEPDEGADHQPLCLMERVEVVAAKPWGESSGGAITSALLAALLLVHTLQLQMPQSIMYNLRKFERNQDKSSFNLFLQEQHLSFYTPYSAEWHLIKPSTIPIYNLLVFLHIVSVDTC